jgi:DNA (cytosine-5)-methyltransferase 1
MPNVIDLFSGAGGLSLGATRSGFNIIGAVENDKFAIDTHTLNFPNVKHLQQDITTLTAIDIKNQVKINNNDLFGVIGGPPCQGFSSMGNQDIYDQRNELFYKFFEIVAELYPDFYLAENVPGILNKKYNELRISALNQLSGYIKLSPLTLYAFDYGAPTFRTRIFFIGYRKDLGSSLTEQDFIDAKVPKNTTPAVEEALRGLPNRIRYSKSHSGQRLIDGNYLSNRSLQKNFFHSRVIGHIPIGVGHQSSIDNYLSYGIVSGCFYTNHTSEVRDRYRKVKCGKADKISKSIKLEPQGFCPTLRAGTGPERGSYQAVRPLHYKSPRVITPREAARLQGFPDWFVFQPTIWHSFRQIGNSVSPLVAERIMSVIYQKLTL